MLVLPKLEAPSLCPTFERQAAKIWDNLGSAHGLGLIRDEETITNDLLLEVQKAHPMEVLTFQFRKPQEARTGADWEWWLTNGRLWLGLLIQAKRLDQNSHKYRDIKRPVGAARTPQIDLLIHEACRKGIDPLYFFYNYSKWSCEAFHWNCGSFAPDRRQLGCTAAHAVGVKRLLHRGGAGLRKMSAISIPMKCLVCCPVLCDPDGSLPGVANGVTQALKKLASDDSDAIPPDVAGPRDSPPWYIKRLLDTPADDRGGIIEELKKEVGPIGTLVVIKEDPKTR